MDLDLPLILVVLSGFGILVWIFDFIVVRPKRNQKIEQFKVNYPGWNQYASNEERKYLALLNELENESVIIRETKSFLPIILLVLVVRSFLVEPFQIPSSSMEPTLLVGDFILVNKFNYGLRLPVTGTKIMEIGEPKRGDVMVFFPPNDKRYFIKRVIGLPGDQIEYHNKVLSINGKVQAQIPVYDAPMDVEFRDLYTEDLNDVKHSIYDQPMRPATDFSTTVQPGHYFMMGDNRDNSSDSRYWGQVPEGHIVGKAFAIWMHWKDWKSIPGFSRVGYIK